MKCNLKKFLSYKIMNIFRLYKIERWYAYGKFIDDYMKYLITNPT